METALTSGIEISVSCQYEERFSNPENGLFMFSYEISIVNKNDFPIKLLRRHWHIVDSNTRTREVEGEGVIGQQPIILPQERYSYRSSCDFTTDTGKMYGTYLMENTLDGKKFEVEIPSFLLMVPHKLN
jgi:ApaG protein